MKLLWLAAVVNSTPTTRRQKLTLAVSNISPGDLARLSDCGNLHP